MGNCQNVQQQQEDNELNTEERKNDLNITSMTWTKDSHGLFDYETKNTIKNSLKINQSGRIVRKENQIEFQQQDQVQNEDAEILLDVLQDNSGQFWINQNKQDKIYDNWSIVKHIPCDKGYKLRQGDLLKLGRVKFKVLELVLDQNWQKPVIQYKKSTHQLEMDNTDIVTDFEYHQTQEINQSRKQSKLNNPITVNLNKNNPINIDQNQQFQMQQQQEENILNNNNSNQDIESQQQQQEQESQPKICRICLSEDEEEDEENPLVNPCKCIGSMKYLHIKCLQKWIYLKMQNQNKQTQNMKIIYLSKHFECEVCKSQYPCKFESEGNFYDLYELSKPVGHPYAGIEIMQISQNRTNYSGYYIIQLNRNQSQKLNIGRSHDSELRISDISVSRQHAYIYWDGEQLYFQDTQSKFGSLVQILEEIPLSGDLDGYAIQCGRTTIQFHMQNNNSGCSIFKSCLNQMQSTQSDDDSMQIQQQEQQN